MQLFSQNDERDFKQSYVINFLAAYDANGYADRCNNGWDIKHLPVIDAEYLAGEAWDAWVKTVGVQHENA